MSLLEEGQRNPLKDEHQMDYLDYLEQQRGGFNFDNVERNMHLVKKFEGEPLRAKKTGTTICGVVVKDGVVLAADTRATAGSIVADKNADKLHPIADNIQCAGAGTSADLTATTELMMRDMELHRLNTGTQVRVCTVVRRLSKMLFKYQGHVGCALVLGGVDVTGPHLYQIYPHGSTDKLPYTTMGSGSLAAMSVLETRYKEDMTIEEGKALVADAIMAGILNDLGSGGNVDVCAITATSKVHTRGYKKPSERLYKSVYPPFTKGMTPVIREDFKKHIAILDQEDESGDVVMGGM